MIMLALTISVEAQRGNAYNDHTLYLSVGGGGSFYVAGGESSGIAVPTVQLTAGRWITNPLAFRITAEMATTPSYYQMVDGSSANTSFFMGSAEFMWNVRATFDHVRPYRVDWPYPLIGLGLIYRPDINSDGLELGSENDFHTMLGLHWPVRFGKHWAAFLEYKVHFLPQVFDGSHGDNYLHSLLVGATYDFSDNPYRRTTAYASHDTREDWFVGFGFGASFSSFEFEHLTDLEAKLWTPSPEIMVGRNFSSVWTIRFELSGFFARERATTVATSAIDAEGQPVLGNTIQPGLWYTYNMLHTDFMINLGHLMGFRRGVKWNFLPYLGAGPVWRYRTHPSFNLGADIGFMARRYITNMGDLYLDLKYLMVPPRIAGSTGESGSILGVGYPIFTIGYIHNFNRSTTRYRIPEHWSPTR